MQPTSLHSCLEKNRARRDSSTLEAELNARLEAEIALVVIALGKVIAKAGQQIVKLCRPFGDVFAKWNVNATANNKIRYSHKNCCALLAEVKSTRTAATIQENVGIMLLF